MLDHIFYSHFGNGISNKTILLLRVENKSINQIKENSKIPLKICRNLLWWVPLAFFVLAINC